MMKFDFAKIFIIGVFTVIILGISAMAYNSAGTEEFTSQGKLISSHYNPAHTERESHWNATTERTEYRTVHYPAEWVYVVNFKGANHTLKRSSPTYSGRENQMIPVRYYIGRLTKRIHLM